jgi:hypothetical protein
MQQLAASCCLYFRGEGAAAGSDAVSLKACSVIFKSYGLKEIDTNLERF